jgi:hypothetical protein
MLPAATASSTHPDLSLVSSSLQICFSGFMSRALLLYLPSCWSSALLEGTRTLPVCLLWLECLSLRSSLSQPLSSLFYPDVTARCAPGSLSFLGCALTGTVLGCVRAPSPRSPAKPPTTSRHCMYHVDMTAGCVCGLCALAPFVCRRRSHQVTQVIPSRDLSAPVARVHLALPQPCCPVCGQPGSRALTGFQAHRALWA